MIRRTSFALALAALAAPASAQFSAPVAVEPAPADLIIEDARIYTPGGWASHMAIAGGTIVAVGGAEDVTQHRRPATRVVDLDGKMVMPGLHDMHVHPSGGGMAQWRCMIPQGSNADAALAFIRGCVEKAEPGGWVEGGGWDTASLGAAPTAAMLDRIAPDNPVFLRDISGHSAWANSRALALARIGAETADPEGGIIERGDGGRPTGVLRENAAGLVAANIPAASTERTAEALDWALGEMLSYGITAFDDAGVFRNSAEAYASLADEGRLKQRVRGCLWGADAELIAERMLYARERFSPSCVKIALDGVPTDGHTAAMLEPYEPLPSDNSGGHGESGREKGLLMIPQDELNRRVIALDKAGLTVKFHAAGDAAVRAGIEAIAAARAANPQGGNLHNVGHNSFIDPADIRRGVEVGAAFEFSPYIWYENPIIPDIRKAVGEERMKRWIPIKDALDAGALVVPGSDWNVVPSVNPWIAIETLVTRQPPGGGGEPLGAAERITLEQAVDIFTRQSARQMNFDYATGTIEEGKLADFIVLDRNIFEIPITDVHQTKVLNVFIAGEQVFEAPPPQ
jgi:predicted amidohydrolase YtcJ